MTDRFEFDHLSIGVRHPLAVARTLRGELGAEPLVGGVLPEFRYLLMHVGDLLGQRVLGGRLELISTPEDFGLRATGFMYRFLERHGEGAHHLSFNVPDLSAVRESLHAAGFRTVQEDLDFPTWQEIFLPPDGLHRVLIQVASTPKPIRTQDLFGTRHRDWSTLPNNRDSADPGWWEPLWEIPAPGPLCAGATGKAPRVGDRAVLGPVVLGTSDLDRSDVLFRRILHGAPAPHLDAELASGRSPRARAYAWPTGALVVVESEAGVHGAVCDPPTNRKAAGTPTHEGYRHVGTIPFSSELEELL